MHFWEIAAGLFLFFVLKYSFMTAYVLFIAGAAKAAAVKRMEGKKQKEEGQWEQL